MNLLAKAILPGGESPGEAFRRVFDSYTKGNEISTDVESGTEIAKIASEDVSGNTTETIYKTSTHTCRLHTFHNAAEGF